MSIFIVCDVQSQNGRCSSDWWFSWKKAPIKLKNCRCSSMTLPGWLNESGWGHLQESQLRLSLNSYMERQNHRILELTLTCLWWIGYLDTFTKSCVTFRSPFQFVVAGLIRRNMRRFWGFLPLTALLYQVPWSFVRFQSSERGANTALRAPRALPRASVLDGELEELELDATSIATDVLRAAEASATVDGSEVAEAAPETDRYKAITIFNLENVSKKIPRLTGLLDDIRMSSLVFPFKVSPYVVEELIDWETEGSIKDDPFYRLVFPTMDMLSPEHQERLRAVRDEPFKLKEAASWTTWNAVGSLYPANSSCDSGNYPELVLVQPCV